MCPHASVTFAVMNRFGVTSTGGNEGEDIVVTMSSPFIILAARFSGKQKVFRRAVCGQETNLIFRKDLRARNLL